VGFFLESVLAQLDYTRIELIAYPTYQKEDDLTARIRPHFSAWKPLYDLSDEAAARLIHADGVHVLLDLSGHTAKNRLPVFAWKPAPVQAMWLGYFATTGVAEMDYILGDKWILPDGEEHHFVEKGWRLSGPLHCLTPPCEDIKVNELPALRNQSITFGTLNNPAKMNDKVVACWARILNAIPRSRLYLNAGNFRDNILRKTVIERYAAHGIAENRLILEATTGRIAALNSYHRIDIALDPFPYPGGTTSYEALWMGVPVLTMLGSNYISHLGESIMHNAGLPDWIAANEEDYIAKAVAFSASLANLAKLRSSLRARVLVSPLFDSVLFASSFEMALWGMWHARTQNNPSVFLNMPISLRD
jgi:protein O-GlcNAc transferase